MFKTIRKSDSLDLLLANWDRVLASTVGGMIQRILTEPCARMTRKIVKRFIFFKYMKSKEISKKKTKMRLYRVAIWPVVTYGAETMSLTKGEEKKPKIFRKGNCKENLRSKENSGRSLPKTQERLRGENIVKAIKTQKLRWYDYIRTMGEEKVVKTVTRLQKSERKTEKPMGEHKKARIHNWGGRSGIGSHG